MAKPNGGSAFPEIETDVVGSQGDYRTRTYSCGGMSLRDWFAGQVIGALVGVSPKESLAAKEYAEAHSLTLHELTAKTAYTVADALLAEREKP